MNSNEELPPGYLDEIMAVKKAIFAVCQGHSMAAVASALQELDVLVTSQAEPMDRIRLATIMHMRATNITVAALTELGHPMPGEEVPDGPTH